MTTLELRVNLSDGLAREAHRGWRQAVGTRQVLQLLDASIERGHLKHQVEESHA
jgi:hypothetical protein